MLDLPMVVTTVLAKKKDCPKLQEETLVPFAATETPRSLALTISPIKSSSADSKSTFFNLTYCLLNYLFYTILYYSTSQVYYISKSNLIYQFFAIRGYKTVNSRMIKKFKCNETQKSCFNIFFNTMGGHFQEFLGNFNYRGVNQTKRSNFAVLMSLNSSDIDFIAEMCQRM